MTNGVVTKTYEQPYELENLNAEASNTNIRCFLVVEGSYIDFLSSEIGTTGGSISEDKDPKSMVLQNVPQHVDVGTSLEEAMAEVTAEVTFGEDGVTKTVAASELSFSAIPDMDTPGQKTLVAAYNKTFQGKNCDTPIMAYANFEVVEPITSIEVTTPPLYTDYYYYISEATQSLTGRIFNPTGMVVTATTSTGSTRTLSNSELSFSMVPAKAGQQTITITAGEGITTTVNVNVKESQVSEVTNSSKTTIGTTNNSTAFWGDFSDEFNVPVGKTKSITFTNYSNLVSSWNNYVAVLRKSDKTEYAVVRADNYGWGAGYEACIHSGTQGDLATWLAGMNGAKVTVYVTNCGNGTADVQAVMDGTTGTTSTQYYLGINIVDPNDLNFALTVDGCHLVFE